MPRPDAPLVVELPRPEADRPAWAKVGIVAAIGFACGVLWPRLTGTRIVRGPPGDSSSQSANTRPTEGSDKTAGAPAPAPSPAASTMPPIASAAPSPTDPALSITVGPGVILRCRDVDDETLHDCGALQFDPIALPVLKGLAQCNTVKLSPGVLSIGFDIDFHRRRVRPLLGKATTLGQPVAHGLMQCVDNSLKSTLLGDIKHRHQRYTVYYTASFGSGAELTQAPKPATTEGPSNSSPTSETPTLGSATVAWDVAVVRDTPRSGAVVGRILRGTKVKLVARQGEWLRIRSGSVDGWAYRGALGM